jgi:hypothetical protein
MNETSCDTTVTFLLEFESIKLALPKKRAYARCRPAVYLSGFAGRFTAPYPRLSGLFARLLL